MFSGWVGGFGCCVEGGWVLGVSSSGFEGLFVVSMGGGEVCGWLVVDCVLVSRVGVGSGSL